LAAFEAWANRAAGTGRLTLAAAAGRLAVAAAFAATDALFAVHSTFNVLKFVEFHIGSCRGSPHPHECGVELGLSESELAGRPDLGDVRREAQLKQTVERSVHHGDVVRRTHRFRQNILHTGGLKDGANATTGDKARARRRGLEHNATTVVLAEDIVRDRVSLELNADEMLVGVGRALLDGIGNFVGFAVADTNLALAVTNDSQCGEREATTTLNDLGAPVDEHDLLDHGRTVAVLGLVTIVATRAAIATGAAITAWATLAAETTAAALTARCTLFARRRGSGSRWCGGGGSWRGALRRGRGFSAHAILELETTFASGVGEDFDFTVIGSATAIEHDRGNSGGLGFEGKSHTENFCASNIGLQFLLAQLCVQAAEKNQRRASIVVDGLGVDVFRGEANSETRACSGAGNFFADSPATFLEEDSFGSAHGLDPEMEDYD
jgi:hypothetical protein